MAQTKRVTITLTEEQLEILKRLAEDQGITATSVIQKALLTENYMHNEVKAKRRILIQDPKDNSLKQVVFR